MRKNAVPPTETTSEKAFTEELGGAKSHPSIPARLSRLMAQGSGFHRSEPTETRRSTARRPPRHRPAFAMLAVAPLLALAGVLAVFAFSAIFMFGVTAAVFFSAAAMALLVPLMG